LAVVNTAVAFTLWNRSLRPLSALESAGINNTMLIQIALLAWVFLGEGPRPWEVADVLAVSAGIFLTQSLTTSGPYAGRERPIPEAGLGRRADRESEAARRGGQVDRIEWSAPGHLVGACSVALGPRRREPACGRRRRAAVPG
jgi:hypothetical protein